MTSYTAESILLFTQSSKGTGREKNDKNNKIREQILFDLFYDNYHEMSIHDKYAKEWLILQEEFLKALDKCIKTYGEANYTSAFLKKVGGRQGKNDYYLQILPFNINLCIEFKKMEGTTKTVDDLPQIIDLSAKNNFHSEKYADYFYDYLPKLKNLFLLSEELPSKTEYYTKIHNDKWDHPFINSLKKADSENSSKNKEKDKLVHQSISEFLIKTASSMNIEEINKKLPSPEKIYIIYNSGSFYLDRISEAELRIKEFSHLDTSGKYPLVYFKTEHKSSLIEFRLSWKNGNGIRFPAWRVNLVRKN